MDFVYLRTIAALLGRIEKTTGPVAANGCRAALSSMFSWAMREGLAQSDPTLNTNEREEHPRDHVLTNDEFATFRRLPRGHMAASLVITSSPVRDAKRSGVYAGLK